MNYERFITELYILPYALPLLISGVVSGFIMYYAGKRRDTPGATPMMVMSYGVIHWSLCTVVSMYQTDLKTLVFLSDIQSLSSVLVAPGWMIFAMRYTGSDRWISRRNLGLLALEPVLFEAFLWTDQWHGLMRTANWVANTGPFPMHYSTFGIGYWLHVIYVYTLVLIGTVLIIRELIRSYHRLYKDQALALIITVSAPWLANMAQLAGTESFIPYIMLTPLAFGISNMALAYGVFRVRLLDVVPLAREAALNSMRDGMVALDRHGYIVDINLAAIQMIGKSGRELIGQRLTEAWPPCPDPDAFPVGESVLRSMETTDPNGQTRHYDIHISPIRATRPHHSGFLLVLIDMTQQRKAEEERLKISKLESLGVMAAGIAHDFNNTLTGVIGYLSMARMNLPQSSPVMDQIAQAEEAAQHAKTLTRQLVTFARGGAPIKSVTSVSRVVINAAMLVPEETSVRRIWRFPDDLWPADLDEGQIAQVVQNLILNAQQAMPDGGDLIITGANEIIHEQSDAPMLAPGSYVRISFEDTGTGITPGIRDKIFDPYFTTKDRGTGLGLTSAFTIIQRHGGTISVSSTPGQGTVFTIHLPAKPGQRKEEEPPPSTPLETHHQKGKGRILVMDDEVVIRKLAEAGLSQFGFEVLCVTDGEKALEAHRRARVENRPFDVVVLDLNIPGGMGGKETAEALNATDPDARLIVSSGYSSDPIMSEYRRYGFHGRMVKPYRIMELADEINRLMQENGKSA